MLSGALLGMCCTWCKISLSYFGALKVTINSMWVNPSPLETVTDSPPKKKLELQIIINTIKQSKLAEIKTILCSAGLMKNLCCFCSRAFIWSVSQAFSWWKIGADWLIKNCYSLSIFFYKYLLNVRVHFYLNLFPEKKICWSYFCTACLRELEITYYTTQNILLSFCLWYFLSLKQAFGMTVKWREYFFPFSEMEKNYSKTIST